MPNINLSPLTAEQSAIDRRRKMAEAMQQQSILPIDMPNVRGAKVSHLQGLAKLFEGYLARKDLEKADTEQKELQANTMSDFAKVFGLMGKTETVPGKEITPAVPSVAIPENVARQAELARLNQPEAGFEAQANIGRTLMRPQDVQQIQSLPTSTAAVPAVMSPDQQVPALKADMLNDPKFTQTSAGKMMLAQALMQQRAQEQAAALKKQEAEQAIIKVGPEDTAGRMVGDRFVPFVTGAKQPKLQRIETNDPLTGMPVIKFLPENVLVEMGNIPARFQGFAADLIMAKNLPAQIMKDPQLLNLVGSQLNKQAGQVTQEDVANYMLRVAETRARLGYEGIKFDAPIGLTAAPNPLNPPAQKITTKAEIAEVAKKSGKTIEQVTQDAIAKGYKVQ
jgi:hypothetical protein